MLYRTDKDITFLKFFVYLMGFILMGGVIFLTYAVYKKQDIMVPQKDIPECHSSFTLDIKGEVYKIIPQDNNKLILVTKSLNNQQEVLLIDYCDSKVINRIRLNNDQSVEQHSYSFLG